MQKQKEEENKGVARGGDDGREMQERVHSAEAGQESDGVVVAGRPVEEQGGAKDQSTAHETEERV